MFASLYRQRLGLHCSKKADRACKSLPSGFSLCPSQCLSEQGNSLKIKKVSSGWEGPTLLVLPGKSRSVKIPRKGANQLWEGQPFGS